LPKVNQATQEKERIRRVAYESKLSEMSERARSVKPDEEVVIQQRMNYVDVAKLLVKHDEVFVRDLNAKQASYAHKRLEILCKCKLEAHQAALPKTHELGYLFHKVV